MVAFFAAFISWLVLGSTLILGDDAITAALRRRFAEDIEAQVHLHKRRDVFDAPGECCKCSTPVSLCADNDDVKCPLVFSPVCGCDGVTYQNECFASQIYCVSCYVSGRCTSTAGKSSSSERGGSVLSYLSMEANALTIHPPFSQFSMMPPTSDDDDDYEDDNYLSIVERILARYPKNCTCPFPYPQHQRKCCHLPKRACIHGQSRCNLPIPITLPPVCGCDGNTYTNACVALVENCVRCWETGPC